MGLTTPRLRITRPDTEPIVVQVLNPDLVRWDRERAKHRWPTAEVAPMLWTTFVAWSAAKRTGAINGEIPYAEWEETTEQIEMVDEQGNPVTPDEVEEADPTHADRGPT